MDIHEEGAILVANIIARKRARMFLEGVPECESCDNPRPGPHIYTCPGGCQHHLCLRCHILWTWGPRLN